MNFDLSEEQHMLAQQARGLIAGVSGYDRLRALAEERAQWDEALWRQLAEMGYLGVTLPAAYGGLEMTALDLGVIQQEFGRANAAIPFFSSIVLAADAILSGGDDAQKSAWLPKLASGEMVGCFAYADGPWGSQEACRVEGGKLSGIKGPVADAGVAGIGVVKVDDSLYLIDLDQPAVRRERLESFDQLRPHYRLHFDDALAEKLPHAGAAMIESLFDRAAVQASFEATGAAEACMEMAKDYALERQIFGRSLASFQAIKHKLADLAVAIELARSSCYYAAWTVDGAPPELAAAASAAKLMSAKAFEFGARENLQVHGGIGYTFEANCHFYYRRERTLAASLFNRDYWAARLLAHRARVAA